MKHRVLILTDLTEIGYDCVSYGLEFCRFYGFSAEILHVETSENGYVNKEERHKTRVITELYNSKFNLGADFSIKPGLLSQVISNEVRSDDFMLIILGTHGISGGFQTLKGSDAVKVITSQSIPILVVQSRKFTPIRKILLPVQKNMSMNSGFGDVVSATETLGAKVDIICRQESFDTSSFFVQKFAEKENVELGVEVIDDDTLNFAKQVISYSETNNVDLILGLPTEIENLQLDILLEQLMFNVPQIPVMCSGY